MIYFGILLLFSSFTECDKPSILKSYLEANTVMTCEVTGYHFEDTKLILEVSTIEEYKNLGARVKFIHFDYSGAIFEHRAGITWMEYMIGKEYLFYLSKNNEEYQVDLCSRIINDPKELTEEKKHLNSIMTGNTTSLWVDNSKLREQDKVVSKIDIDSLITADKRDFSNFSGYPVVITNLLIDQHGNLKNAKSGRNSRMIISDKSELKVESYKAIELNELERWALALTSQLLKWKPASIGGKKVNSVVQLRWELAEDKESISCSFL